MKIITKLSALLGAALLLVATGCQKELSTAQYDDNAVTLASFGPNPVMRGAQLRFFGSNLDQVVKVVVPGVDPITSIEVVKTGKVGEIRVSLPVEGPEVGYVTLVTKDNVELRTKSELTYTEPIVFDSFEAKEVSMPGDVVTFRGDYMNLVKAVVFAGGTEVAVLEGATRHEAQAVIPADALTGLVILSDKGQVENLFYSEKELVIGEPVVKANAKATYKAGATVSVNGEHLEMIEVIRFQGAEVKDFTLASDGSTISFEIPATATDGEYVFVSYAGKEYKAGEIETVAPSGVKAAPSPVKAGATLTITGSDLDLVTKVSFEGVESADFVCTDGAIKVVVANTVKEGDVTLTLENGKTVSTPVVLVHPTVTEVDPLELTAGGEITVKGTDLDLITAATLGGRPVDVKAVSESEIKLVTTVSSVGGKIVLSLANGETVEPEAEIKLNYDALVIVKSIPEAEHIGQEVVITGEKLSLIENIFIGDVKVTQYSLRKDDEVHFLMPWNKVGKYDVAFHLFNGDVEVQPNKIEVLLELEVQMLFEGSFEMGDWGGFQNLAYGAFDWSTVAPGTDIVLEFELSGPKDWHQISFRHGEGWGELPDKVFHEMGPDETVFVHTLTASDIADLVANNGLVITGTSYILHKVYLVKEIPQEIVMFEGEWNVGDWTNWVYGEAPGENKNFFKEHPVTAGMQLLIYVDLKKPGEKWQLQMFNGHWEGMNLGINSGAPNNVNSDLMDIVDGRIVLTINESMASDLNTKNDWDGCGAVIFQAENLIVKKIAIL